MNEWKLKLLYDGQCPMCRREAKWLQRRNRAGQLVFEDISAPDFDPLRYGLTQAQVMGVMHGILPDGRVVTKVEVFRRAYQLVGLGWLLAPTRWPVFRGLANWSYEWFARHRVAIGKCLGDDQCENARCDVASRENINPPVVPKT